MVISRTLKCSSLTLKLVPSVGHLDSLNQARTTKWLLAGHNDSLPFICQNQMVHTGPHRLELIRRFPPVQRADCPFFDPHWQYRLCFPLSVSQISPLSEQSIEHMADSLFVPELAVGPIPSPCILQLRSLGCSPVLLRRV